MRIHSCGAPLGAPRPVERTYYVPPFWTGGESRRLDKTHAHQNYIVLTLEPLAGWVRVKGSCTSPGICRGGRTGNCSCWHACKSGSNTREGLTVPPPTVVRQIAPFTCSKKETFNQESTQPLDAKSFHACHDERTSSCSILLVTHHSAATHIF